MFQTFRAAVANEGQDPSSARLSRLRAELSRLRVDAFLVPRADEHLGEYVPPSAERLRWVSGFSGSAGLAIVTAEAAALLVDGRYTVQARQEVDGGAIEVLQTPAASASAWLAAKLPAGAVVGFDSRLHPVAEIERLTTALSDHRITLKALAASSASLGGRVRGSAASPLDVAWGSAQPAPPLAKAVPHPLEYAGREAREKIAAVQAVLKDTGQDAVVLTIPDSICWLFNIRGQDVAHNPVVLAHAIVPADGPAELFIAPEKVDRALKAHLGRRVVVSPPSVLAERLAALRSDGRKVRVDPASASVWIARQLGGAGRIVRGSDPCVLPKAIKNVVEIEGARRAHVRDGAAMVRFLAWLAQQQPGKGLDEITVVERLEACRRETGALREISFDTISGSGPNGAIVHYRVNEASNRKIGRGELLLVDSGGQYADGTTDITRTMAIGMPTAEMRNRYTRVLKGHVALSMARFPVGTRGIDLDPLARRALWQAGLDFDHGTGHGVGSYLSVHEGPASISRRGMVALEPGMIISNEPGYYKEGGYGIRIENLVLVTPAAPIAGGDRAMMGFETLTLAPYERALIEVALLDAEEIAWIDAYHARVGREIGPQLGTADRQWLRSATAPLVTRS